MGDRQKRMGVHGRQAAATDPCSAALPRLQGQRLGIWAPTLAFLGLRPSVPRLGSVYHERRVCFHFSRGGGKCLNRLGRAEHEITDTAIITVLWGTDRKVSCHQPAAPAPSERAQRGGLSVGMQPFLLIP